ncbi:MAG: TonB-dependent receptor [Candidatus Eisenbacteria bacterium]
MGPRRVLGLRFLSIATPLTLALTAASAFAEPANLDSSDAEPRYRLEPIVVTAERMPLPLGRVSSDVTVLSGTRLDRERPLFLADALRSVPGIDVQRAGRLGKLTDVRLRGADPRHTLVLFDGIPLNGPWVGSFDFSDIGSLGWSQVEVVGGPASSLYGSGAVGGVIQFLGGGVGDGRMVRAGAEIGAEATRREHASMTRRLDGGSLALSLARASSDGSGTRDGYRGWNGLVRAEAALDPATRVRLSGLLTHGVKELPYDYTFDFGDFRTHQVADPNYEERDRLLAGSVLLTRAVGRAITLEGDLSALAGRIVNDNQANGPGGDYQDTRLDNSRWIGSLRASAVHGTSLRAVAGGEYRNETVDRDDDAQFGGYAYPSAVDEALHTRALFAQGHAELPRGLVASAGIRVEDHARYGAFGVPRFSVALNLARTGLRLRGGYGRAFTAPTLTDLHYPGYGTASLKPERSRTVEAGADGRWLDGRIEARVTWHRTRFTDLIQSNSFYVADNVGSARIEGKDVSLRLRPWRRIAIGARAAHLPVAKDVATGVRLGKRPRWRSGADLDWEATPTLRIFGAWRWSDSFRDPFDFVDVSGRFLDGDTPGYAMTDFGATMSPPRWPVALSARIENAFDRQITEVKGLPARGRALTLGVEFRR